MARQPDQLSSLAANIRSLRERRGWTQEQLAESAGLATRYVQTLESPKANPRVLILVATADALSLAAWRANLMADDPVKTIWLMCSIASLLYGWNWQFLDVIEHSAGIKPLPRA